MKTCKSCGGVLGLDCFNETECMYISQQQELHRDRDNQDMSLEIDRLKSINAELVEALKLAKQTIESEWGIDNNPDKMKTVTNDV